MKPTKPATHKNVLRRFIIGGEANERVSKDPEKAMRDMMTPSMLSGNMKQGLGATEIMHNLWLCESYKDRETLLQELDAEYLKGASDSRLFVIEIADGVVANRGYEREVAHSFPPNPADILGRP